MRNIRKIARCGIFAFALVTLILVDFTRQAQAQAEVSIRGIVVAPNQQPIRNPLVSAHLIEQDRMVYAKLVNDGFEFKLSHQDQTDEIVIYCTALGTVTKVPHISGRKDTEGVVIVHRGISDVTNLAHVQNQLQALSSAAILVPLGVSNLGKFLEHFGTTSDPFGTKVTNKLIGKLNNMPNVPEDLKAKFRTETELLADFMDDDEFKARIRNEILH